MKKELVSTRVTKTTIEYVKLRGGDVSALLEGIPYDLNYLTSTDGWVTCDCEVILQDRARRLLEEEEAARNIGRYTASPQALGLLSAIARMFSSPKSIYERSAQYVPYFNRAQRGAVTMLGDNECVFDLIHNKEEKDYFYQYSGCETAVGILEAIPTIFNMPLATVKKETCGLSIDMAGRVGGLYYGVDDQGNVTAYFDEARTVSSGPKGRLEEDGTFTLNGIRFGSENCRFHVVFPTKKGILHRIRNYFLSSQSGTHIEEMEKANAELERQYDELKAQELKNSLYAKLAMVLIKQHSLEEMLYLIVSAAVEIAEATEARIYLVESIGKIRQAPGGFAVGNAEHEKLIAEIVKKYDLHTENLNSSGHPDLVDMIKEGIPRVYKKVSDYMTYFWSPEICKKLDEEMGIKQAVVMPLKMSEEFLGIMVVVSSKEIDVESLQPIANIAAQAIWNSRQMEKTRMEKERLERLQEIQLAMDKKGNVDELLDFIASSARELTDSLAVRIFILDQKSRSITKKHIAIKEDVVSNFIRKEIGNPPMPLVNMVALEDVLVEKFYPDGFTEGQVVRPGGLSRLMEGYWTPEFCEKAERELGIRDIAAIFLKYGENKLGIMIFTSGQKMDDNLLLMLAGQAAQAVREAQYIDEIRRNRDRLEELVWARTGELERTNKELKEAQTFMLQREKMASLGQLAAGVAHEINNPIAYVYSNLNVMQEYIEEIQTCYKKVLDLQSAALKSPDERVKGQAEEIVKAIREQNIEEIFGDIGNIVKESRDGARRVKEIVENLKNFSRPGEKQATDADLNVGIEQSLMVIWNELKYKATIHKELNSLPFIKCYPQELNQVFMNLILNAVQSIPQKGEIWIRSSVENGSIRIEVEDNGAGIPPENINCIFDPFFTTKEVGHGTGLGLAISYGIVRNHGGLIEVESEVGKGSRFTVVLPASGLPQLEEIENESDNRISQKSVIESGKERVL